MFASLVFWPILRTAFQLLRDPVTAWRTRGAWMVLLQANRDERATAYIIHRKKTEWIFSGVDRGTFGTRDMGFTRSPRLMNRAQAHRYLRNWYPQATIIHVDDRHKVITYSVSK